MKKILFFLLFISTGVFSQSINLANPAIVGQTNRNQKFGNGAEVTDSLIGNGLVAFTGVGVSSDTTLNKPVGMNAAGYLTRMSSWFGGSSPGVTSISQGYGITNTPNPIVGTGTVKVDSATLSTTYFQKNDTLSNLATKYYALTHQDSAYTPNFGLKVRSLLSVISPATYVPATGKIGVDTSILATRSYVLLNAGTVTSVARTNGYAISASVSNPTTTPNITITLDSSTLFQTAWQRRDTIGTLATKNDINNKVPVTRTISTTSPLSGGGALSGNLTLSIAKDTSAIEFIIDGGGSVPSTGVKGDLEIPFNCTIVRATMLADQSGSAVVQIWSALYSAFPPTVANSIYSATPPTITTATKSQDSSLSGWSTAIPSGNTLRFNLSSIATITRLTISLKIVR